MTEESEEFRNRKCFICGASEYHGYHIRKDGRCDLCAKAKLTIQDVLSNFEVKV